MKAVNLIPQDARKGGRAKIGPGLSSGMGAYVLLAALAVAVLMAGAWAVTGKQLSDNKADLARVEQEAQVAEAKVSSLAPYKEFAALSASRVETIGGLVNGRFDWSHGLREVARVVPANIDLVSLVGTVSPTSSAGGSSGGGGAGGGSLRAALPVPAIDLIGCARSQSHVARLLARLRAVDGVQRVSLSSSEKTDTGSLSDTDCRANVKMPQFQLTVFFQPKDGIVPQAAATATSTTTAPAASTAAPAGGAK